MAVIYRVGQKVTHLWYLVSSLVRWSPKPKLHFRLERSHQSRFSTPFIFRVMSWHETDRRMDGRTARQDQWCGLLGRPHNNAITATTTTFFPFLFHFSGVSEQFSKVTFLLIVEAEIITDWMFHPPCVTAYNKPTLKQWRFRTWKTGATNTANNNNNN